MIPGLIINPDADKDELREGIGFLVGEAKAIAAVIQGEIETADRNDILELSFAIKNHLDYINELWIKYQQS